MMSNISKCSTVAAIFAAAVVLTAGVPLSAAPRGSVSKPDFTKGDSIPEQSDHDWTLGPTGARGWMYSNRLETSEARQIAVTKVANESPAHGVLAVGDVILGVSGKPFSYDPRTELGKAITVAESEAGGGKLSLIRWRSGKTEAVEVQLPVLGTYSSTAPFDCPKSKRIFERGCEALADRVADPSYRENPIVRSLNALALLASDDPAYRPILKKEAHWAAGVQASSFQTWWYGYTITFLAEYVMATDDTSVMPGLKRLALESANGQSIVGSWGHKFANPEDGRLFGYGMMNSPGIPLTTGLILARQAGVKDPEVERAIERSLRLLRFYIGKGAIPYGDHHPWMQTHEDNGKCGMAAVMFNLLEEPQGATFFSRMSLASHGSERDTGHTGNFFNITWSLPGVAPLGPHATGAWMKEFGAWYFDLARQHDGTFLHQGPPQVRKDKYRNWDCTGAYLLAYGIPRKTLCVTGKEGSCTPQLDAREAQRVVQDGHGWSNNDRNRFYDLLSTDELLSRLSNWSPIVRERAAMALGRRQDAVVESLIGLLRSRTIEARYGACQAIKQQGSRAAQAVPELRQTLDADDLWLRILAAEALAAIGEPAKVAVPDLLTRLAQVDVQKDPRAMEQRYLCFSVFAKRGGLLGNSLEGVDREQVRQAVRAGLQNEDGRARGSLGTVYGNLTFEEIKPLLPAIHEAIVTPAPSGIMFAAGIRLAGVDLLARHRIREGMPLCIDVMEIDKWGKQQRISQCLKALGHYGSAAKPLLPRLRQLEKDLLAHREAKSLQSHIADLRKLIKQIESSSQSVELRSLGGI